MSATDSPEPAPARGHYSSLRTVTARLRRDATWRRHGQRVIIHREGCGWDEGEGCTCQPRQQHIRAAR